MTALFSPYLTSPTFQQDIPFYIRIPESIPPTLALENGGAFNLTTLPGHALISGAFKLVSSTSLWVKYAFEASRTYLL
jgi:hypothetical protein